MIAYSNHWLPSVFFHNDVKQHSTSTCTKPFYNYLTRILEHTTSELLMRHQREERVNLQTTTIVELFSDYICYNHLMWCEIMSWFDELSVLSYQSSSTPLIYLMFTVTSEILKSVSCIILILSVRMRGRQNNGQLLASIANSVSDWDICNTFHQASIFVRVFPNVG